MTKQKTMITLQYHSEQMDISRVFVFPPQVTFYFYFESFLKDF